MTSLWGTLPTPESVRPPVSILREQAAALGEGTNNLLQAEVIVKRSGDDIDLNFSIVAPALDHYRYVVATVRHGVAMYPLRMFSQVEGEWIGYEDESEFVEGLRYLLQSEEIHRVIAALLAQSQTGWAT